MIRNILLYAIAGCGAIALANLVWAQPGPGKVGPPMPVGPVGKVGVVGKSGPTDFKKVDVKPIGKLPMPKFDPIDAKKIEPKIDPKFSKGDPIGKIKIDPKVDPKIDTKFEPKIDPKVLGPLVLKKPTGDKVKDVSPALKLPGTAKFDVKELTKIKPVVDLTKISGDKLVKMTPPADFKVKPIDLGKIQLPADAMKVGKLNAKLDLNGQKFILNKDVFKGNNYHLLHGVKCAWGYCYPGHHHCHWHHCIWDPCCGCYYYYDPCCSCYYYWSGHHSCYYPCWWFVDYCDCYYPWWVCGGFETYGYHCHPHHKITIHIGW